MSGTISGSVSNFFQTIDQFEFWERVGNLLLAVLVVYLAYRLVMHFVFKPIDRQYESFVHKPDNDLGPKRVRALWWSVLVTWLILSVLAFAISGHGVVFPALLFGIWWLYAAAVWTAKMVERLLFERASVASIVLSYAVSFAVLSLASIFVVRHYTQSF